MKIIITEEQLNRLVSESGFWANTSTLKPMDEENQPLYSKEQLKTMGMEIQKGLKDLVNRLKNKIVKISEREYYILDLNLRSLSTLSKKDHSIIGDIEITYSENPQGSKLRQQVIVGHFKNTDTPMVVNEFNNLFTDSLTGSGGYKSTELQNYLNSVVTKVLGNK